MMTALAMLKEFFQFFVDLFKSILSGFTGIFAGEDETEA